MKTFDDLSPLGKLRNSVVDIDYYYDLGGQLISLAEGCSLNFCGGGIQNGRIAGNNSTLLGAVKLSNVTLSGTWTMFGPTTNRPTSPLVGDTYFDTTLGKPIWYKGSNAWVDATGSTV